MKTKSLFTSLLATSFLALSLSSCDDAKLAKELQGTWKSDPTTAIEDGCKFKDVNYMTFKHVESNEKDGGEYTETHKGKGNFEEDGMFFKVEYTVTVSGEYEVLAGDLYLKYDVSTLNVSIDDVNYGATKDSDIFTQANMLGSVMDGSWSETRRLIKQEMQPELYNDFYEQVQQWNEEEAPYGNLEIEGNKLSYDTDEGRMTLTKSNNTL